MSRNSVHHNRGNITLDQWPYIVDEFIGYIRTVFRYPFSRHKFFIVGDLVYIFHFGSALVRIIRVSNQ